MLSQLAKRTSDQNRLSRRSMLRGAATVGAAGLAATAIGGSATPAMATPTRPSSDRNLNHNAETAGPITVHVRDARTGDIEVFSGTSQTRLRDKHLAALIAKAIA